MTLLYNKTKCTQILDVKNYAIPTAILPGMVFDPTPYVIPIKTFFEEFNPSKIIRANSVFIHRQFALGDLIQLVPIFRKLRTDYNVKKVGLLTSDRFVKDMGKSYPDIDVFSMEYSGICKADFIFNLDGVLEKDHSLQNSENQKHRAEIYLDFFGLKNDGRFDWSAKIPDLNINFGKDMKTIGLQIKGSGPIKTLPKDFVKRVSEELAKKYKVVLLDNDRDSGWEGKNIINLCGKVKVPECIAVLTMLDCVLTMDSGMLWMAHSAKCPTITFLGSTREQERMSLHPLYPEKAKVINMAKIVGCEPCFETRVRCKGKHNCMTAFNRDIVMKEIWEKVTEIVE